MSSEKNLAQTMQKDPKEGLQQCLLLLYTCWWLIFEFACNFGKEWQGETSSCLPVTYATFAVACLAALNSKGSKQAVWKKENNFILRISS